MAPYSLILAGGIAYGLLGAGVLHLLERKARPRRPSLHAAPDTWLALTLPQAIIAEVWTLIGGGLLDFLLSASQHIYEGPYGTTAKLDLVIGLAGFAVLCAAFDVLMVLRVRQVARRQH